MFFGLDVVPRADWIDVSARVVRHATGTVSGVVIHHSATANRSVNWERERAAAIALARAIYRHHTEQNGWADIGYHLLISRGGLLIEGRRNTLGLLEQGKIPVGAHCPSKNATHVGICLEGNFMDGVPTEDQLQVLATVIAEILWRNHIHGIEQAVLYHRDVRQTQCPGEGMVRVRHTLIERIRSELVAK